MIYNESRFIIMELVSVYKNCYDGVKKKDDVYCRVAETAWEVILKTGEKIPKIILWGGTFRTSFSRVVPKNSNSQSFLELTEHFFPHSPKKWQIAVILGLSGIFSLYSSKPLRFVILFYLPKKQSSDCIKYISLLLFRFHVKFIDEN